MPTKKPDIAKLMNELDEIVRWFESDDVDLNEAIKKYERGNELIVKLKAQLKQAKNTVKKIETKFSNPKK